MCKTEDDVKALPAEPALNALSAGEASDTEASAVHALDTTNLKPISELKRFAILTAAVFAMLCGSTSYAFNLFSGQLQAKYNYDSRAMSSINTVGMVFAYFLLPYGYLFDYLGPRVVYTLGCVLFPVGALLMGLTFQGVIAGSVVRFAVYNALLSLGSQLFDLATVVTVLSVFPTQRGWVIALLKTMMGLGSAIIGCIQIGFFRSSPAGYFYFLIGLVVVVGAAVQLVIKLPPYHLTGYELSHLSEETKARRVSCRTTYLTQSPPMWRFYLGLAVMCVLVVYLPMTSALVAFLKLDGHARMGIAIAAIALTCAVLLMLVPCPWLDRRTTKRVALAKDEDVSPDVEPAALPKDVDAKGNAVEAVPAVVQDAQAITGELVPSESSAPRAPQPKPAEIATDVDFIAPQYQTTFWGSVRTATLWCIFWTMFCGVGAEFVIIFNARFIYSALSNGPVDDTVATLLTVINGVGSAVGRLAMSYFEVWTQRRKAEDRLPITISFFVPTCCIIVSIVLFLVLPGRSLLVAYAVASLGNGFCASITILVLRTIYAKDPAKHYNFGYNALWLAAILLNRLLYGEWYAHQAEKQHRALCMGRGCVMLPLLVMLGLNATAFISNVYVHVRYSRYNSKVLAERRQLKWAALRVPDGSEAFPPVEKLLSSPSSITEAVQPSDDAPVAAKADVPRT